jgi:hypothetical protein
LLRRFARSLLGRHRCRHSSGDGDGCRFFEQGPHSGRRLFQGMADSREAPADRFGVADHGTGGIGVNDRFRRFRWRMRSVGRFGQRDFLDARSSRLFRGVRTGGLARTRRFRGWNHNLSRCRGRCADFGRQCRVTGCGSPGRSPRCRFRWFGSCRIGSRLGRRDRVGDGGGTTRFVVCGFDGARGGFGGDRVSEGIVALGRVCHGSHRRRFCRCRSRRLGSRLRRAGRLRLCGPLRLRSSRRLHGSGRRRGRGRQGGGCRRSHWRSRHRGSCRRRRQRRNVCRGLGGLPRARHKHRVVCFREGIRAGIGFGRCNRCRTGLCCLPQASFLRRLPAASRCR